MFLGKKLLEHLLLELKIVVTEFSKKSMRKSPKYKIALFSILKNVYYYIIY